MIELSAAERFLDTMRAARIAGDADAAADLFDDEAVFSIVGLDAVARGRDAIRAALASLIEQFEFVAWDRIGTFVNGDDIATCHRLTVRHRPSGRIMDTQTSEFLSMKDGRCRSFTQYADTAAIAALTAS